MSSPLIATIKKITALIILMIGSLLTLGLINTWHWVAWDFRNNLWGPAYLLVHGQSPYNVSLLFTHGRAVWFPMVIGLAFPLGWLPQYIATNLWLIGNVLAVIGIMRLATPPEKFSLPLTIMVLIAFFLFPATVAHLRLGQFTLIATWLWLQIISFEAPPSNRTISLLMALSLSKPQLNILVLPGLCVAYIHRYGLKQTAHLLGWLTFWVILSTLPLFIAHPLWLQDFLSAQRSNPTTWLQPSLFLLLRLHFGTLGGVISAFIASMIIGLTVWLWLRQSNYTALLWSLALTPLITPYVWSWDFVMIAPLWINTVFRLTTLKRQLFLGVAYLGCWVGMMSIELSHDVSNHRYWWVSWYLMLVITGLHFVEKKASLNKNLPPLA